MSVTFDPPFALTTPLAWLEYPRAVPVFPLPVPRAGLMPFIVADEFYETVREFKLPPESVSPLMLAGPWSARNSRSGFVPSSVLADFCDDPEFVVRTWTAAGLARRVKGGTRFVEGCGLTVINAKDVQRDIEQEKAEAEEQRAKWKAVKQRQRAEEKAERAGKIAAGVSPVSTGTNGDVHPENRAESEKPQVSAGYVQVDIAKTSTRTTETTPSDYQDQDQSAGVSQVRGDPNNACAREPLPPEVVALVVAAIAKKAKRAVTEAEAMRAITAWDRRAKKAGNAVHNPVTFYPTCARHENDIELILAPPPDPKWEELGNAPEPVPGGHPYEHDKRTGACAREECQMPEKHARHQNQRKRAGAAG